MHFSFMYVILNNMLFYFNNNARKISISQVDLYRIITMIVLVCLFWPHLWYMEIPRPGIKFNCSCDLSHSCSNAGSLTCCATVGVFLLIYTITIHLFLYKTIKSFVFVLLFCLFVVCLFQGHTCSIWLFPGQGSNIPQPQQHRIRAMSVTYTTAHGNTGSLTH